MHVHQNAESLGTEKLSKLMLKFSIPCILSLLVSSLYNIVDQIFIGNSELSTLGNAATGVVFPVFVIAQAFAWCIGDGCAAHLNICQGKGDYKTAPKSIGTGITVALLSSLVILAVFYPLGTPVLYVFGASEHSIDYAYTYLMIVLGFLPVFMIMNMMNAVIRADGCPAWAMASMLAGAITNIALDAVFIFACKWGMAGAAWATFISQAISCVLTLAVLLRKLKFIKSDEKPKLFDKGLLRDLTVTSVPIILQQSFVSVGNFFVNKRINQIGEDATTGFTTAFKLICIATMSIVSMTNGLSNYCSQNKAAGETARVKKGYIAVMVYSLVISLLFLAVFVSCPQFLTQLFVQKDKLTDAAMDYSVQFITIVSCFVPVVCVKIVSDGTVRGCGGNLGFTISTLIDLVLRVILVYVLTDAGWGFSGVCWAWAIGWSISAFIAVGFLLLIFGKLNRKPLPNS